MLGNINETIAAIIKNIFRREYPKDIESGIKGFFADENYAEQKDASLRDEWDEIEYRSPKLGDYSDLDKVKKKLGYESSLFRRRRAVRFAAVFIPIVFIAAGGYLLLWRGFQRNVNVVSHYVSARGEVKEVALPDGSSVWMNAESQMKYIADKEQGRRVVELAGEAYFYVAQDKDNPFVVRTEKIDVTVLGTEFNVKAYPESLTTKVTLDKGSVQLTAEGGRLWKMKPGERFLYNVSTGDGEVNKLNGSEASDDSDWRTGRTVCSQYTISELFKEVERAKGVDVIITDSATFSDKRYRVVIESYFSADHVMEMLSEVSGEFTYTIEGKRVIIKKN